MTRSLPVLISLLCLCACATQSQRVAGNSVGPERVDAERQAAATIRSDTATQSSDTLRNADEAGLHSIEPPPVKPSEVPVAATDAGEPVCRYEARTGSHRRLKVCRTRAQLKREEEEGKDAFETLRNSQTQASRPFMGEN